MSRQRIPGINIFYSFSLPLWKQLALTVLSVLIALIATTVMRPVITGATLLPFTAAVAFGAYLAGVRGAVLAAVLGYVLVEYFFVEPTGVLFPQPDNYLRAALFVLVGALIGWLQQQWRIAWLAQKSTRDELESILTAAADGIMMLDPSLNVLYANPQAQKLLGLTSPFAHGGPLLSRLNDDLQFCDELEAALATEQLPFRKAVATGRVGEAIFGCGPKTGSIERWISIKAAPVLDEKRRVKSVIAVFTDYSLQRRSLKKAQDERDRLRSIFEVMSDAVILSDTDGVLDMLNASAEKLTGISAADARGHMMTEIYTLEPAEANGILLADVSAGVSVRRLPPASWLRTASGQQIPVSGSVMALPEQMGKVVILRDLREETMLERQRVQSEQRLRDMIDNIVCQVALVDSTGRLLEYNGGRANNNGHPLTRGERLPFPVSRIQEAADQLPPVVIDSFERALRGELVRLDLEVPIDQQEPRSFDMQVAPLYDDTGRISNVVFSAVEITERKQAQRMTAALAQLVNAERKRLEDIIEGIPAIVWESSGRPGDDHRITFINHYTEELLGLSLEEWSKREQPWKSIMHPEDTEQAMGEMQARFDSTADAPGAPIQFRVSARDGTVLELEMRVTAIRDENGQPVGLRGIALDITPQKEAERRIGQLMKLVEIGRKRLQDTIDAVPAIVWEAVGPPEAQRMVFVSNYAEILSGYTSQEWMEVPGIGRSMIVPEDYEQAMHTVNLNYYDDANLPVHYRLRRKDGEIRWVEARVSMVRDTDSNPIGVRGVTTDITELRQVEAELRRSNEELQQFAYVASHDLQEPLRMVTSYLQLIEQRYASQLDEQAHEFIGFAVGGAARMKQLINDLLAYSRVQTNREAFKPVDLSTLVEGVLTNLGPQIEETGAVVECDPLPTVRGNGALLTQLFQNLLNNALKFHSGNTPKIEVRVERHGPMWQFAVRDNGIGLDTRYADRIFVLFQRLHSQAKYSGTGIGLTICKKVVESHSGEIWVESQPGQGSTFFFTLPARMNGENADAE
jgi:PAS domain S-box-containing protein